MEKILNLHNRNDIQLCIWKNIPPLINLKEFHGIYIGGGNTWSLMKEIKSSIFYNSLINYIENGGLIYGGSAGAIIIGKRIDTQTDENAVDLKDFQGFDMLNGYSIACHFNKKQTKKFKKWSEDNNLPIICLPEDNGIVINSKKIKCIGSSECIIFTPKKCITLNNNESFNIN
jgi:dipeptidase E